jgi:hypothetical protein
MSRLYTDTQQLLVMLKKQKQEIYPHWRSTGLNGEIFAIEAIWINPFSARVHPKENQCTSSPLGLVTMTCQVHSELRDLKCLHLTIVKAQAGQLPPKPSYLTLRGQRSNSKGQILLPSQSILQIISGLKNLAQIGHSQSKNAFRGELSQNSTLCAIGKSLLFLIFLFRTHQYGGLKNAYKGRGCTLSTGLKYTYKVDKSEERYPGPKYATDYYNSLSKQANESRESGHKRSTSFGIGRAERYDVIEKGKDRAYYGNCTPGPGANYPPLAESVKQSATFHTISELAEN